MTFARFQFDPFRESGEVTLSARMIQVSKDADDLSVLAGYAEEIGREDWAEVLLTQSREKEEEYRELRRKHEDMEDEVAW
jgi:hypothetical protein